MESLEAYQCTLTELRQALPIAYVLERFGHFPAFAEGGRLHYHSPFRPDENPSFDVFTNKAGVQRWGDYAEGTQGGVIDLVRRFEHCSDGEAINRARDLLAEMLALVPAWEGPRVEAAGPLTFDMTYWSDLLKLGRSPYAWEGYPELVASRPALADADLRAAGVVQHPQMSALCFPYVNHEGVLVGVKLRFLDGDKRAVPGSKFGFYLPAPGDAVDRERPVLLCEGETDALAAWSVHGASYLVAGVPGARMRPDNVDCDFLRGRVVTICFDPDSAGMSGTWVWKEHLESLDCAVRIVIVPKGQDIASLTASRIRELPDQFRSVLPPPPSIKRQQGRFFREGRAPVELSNWSFEPAQLLRGTAIEERAYRGKLRPHGIDVVITADDLVSTRTLTRWGQALGAVWYGHDSDVRLLAALLAYESSLLPEGRITRRAGLHNGDFVWPEGHLGSQPWVYVPPINDVGLRSLLRLESRQVDPVEVVKGLLSLHRPEIMTPLLAWCALAPLRPLFHQFPILSITGGSGTGKTTLTEIVLDVFNGSKITTNLTSSTPYAVAAFFSSVNAFPVWFDEYRPGARIDAKAQLDQLLRDAYTGQPSMKGGLTEHKAEVTALATDAPVVVTGEDSFVETSHTDRMVLLRLTKNGRGNPHAFHFIDYRGFALHYLRWLSSPDHFGEIISHSVPPIDAVPIPGLNDRQAYNVALLRYGWTVLRDYLHAFDRGFDLPELDLSMVIPRAADAASTSPMLDALQWAYSQTFTRPVLIPGVRGYVHISPENLLYEIRRAGIFTMPGSNVRSIRELLVDQYGGIPSKVKLSEMWGSKQIRTIRVSKDVVGLEHEDDDDPNESTGEAEAAST